MSILGFLGVSFRVWEEARDSAGRVQAGHLEWTSLGGTDKLKLLRNLPPHFASILPPSLDGKLFQLWQVSILFSVSVHTVIIIIGV